MIYAYTARSYESGEQITGVLEGESPEDINEILRQKNLILIKCKQKNVRNKHKVPLMMGKMPQKKIIPITHHLKILERAGVPLIEGLNDLVEVTSDRMLKKVLQQMILSIRNGSSLSEAMRGHPKIFPSFYLGLVEMGEQSGTLDETLDRLAAYMEKKEDTRGRIFQALTYPAILSTALGGLLILLLTFVLPRITKMYKTMGPGVELPEMTLIVLAISGFLRTYGLILLGIAIFFFLMFIVMRKIPKTRYFFDFVLLKIPALGTLVTKDNASAFSHAMLVLQKAGIHITKSLQMCEGVINNTFVKAKIAVSRRAVAEGTSLYESLKGLNVFPPLVVSMIKIGENTGNIDETLSLVCKYYDEEIPRAIKKFISIAEPAIIVCAGGLVLFVILATLLPIYTLISAIA